MRSSLFVLAPLMATSAAMASPIVITDSVDVSARSLGKDVSYAGNLCPELHYGCFENDKRVSQTIVTTTVTQTNKGPKYKTTTTYKYRYWGDEIDARADDGTKFSYDTQKMEFVRDDDNDRLTISLFTSFSGDDKSFSPHIKYADLFFDTRTPDAPDSFGYAIALGSQQSLGGVGAGVYQLTSPGQYLTSQQIWDTRSAIYGGFLQFNESDPRHDPSFALTVPTRVIGGIRLNQFGVTVNRTQISPLTPVLGTHLNYNGAPVPNTAEFYRVDVIVTGMNLNLFSGFDILWGTGDCANDAIWGTVNTPSVPAPGAALLLSLGLAGLAGTRRRASENRNS